MLNNLAAVVKQLNFNAKRALDEVNDDYSTTTELADILQRDANVPFRVGHHFASELVNYGRGNNLRPARNSLRSGEIESTPKRPRNLKSIIRSCHLAKHSSANR